MNKNQELDKLFERWIAEFPQYKNKLYKDGIINEQEYERQKTKLLFIAKEPNDPEQNEGDFREFLSKEVRGSFFYRISEWTYGLLNNFPLLNEIENCNRIDIISKIAFMNIKKSGGKSSVGFDVIEKVLEVEYSLILSEIDIISPDIIIGCFGSVDDWKYLWPDIQFNSCGYDIGISKINNYKIINYYHPSYPVPKAMSYCLLKCVYNSEIFKNL